MLMLKRQVQSLIDKSAFTQALSLAAGYARRNPDCVASHQLVATIEESAGYTKAAIQTISHAIRLAPEETALRILRARLLVKDHRINEAIEDVKFIIAAAGPRRDEQMLRDAIACRDELLERLLSAPLQRKQPRTAHTSIRLAA